MNKIGMGAPNGSADISDMLSMGFGTYLIVNGGHGPDQARQIKQRYPQARLYVRRVGGIGGSPLDVVTECLAMMDAYAPFGVIDVIPWNEADRVEEGGFSSSYIAHFAEEFLTLARGHMPTYRLHWPALAHLDRYQGDEPHLWVPTASKFDVIDVHAYNDPGNVRAFFQWCSTTFPDKPVACTEYNFGPGNPRPADYGDWIYEAYRLAIVDYPQAESVCPFIWEWINPEPGVGSSLDIRRDDQALSGIRRAFTIPVPLSPLPPEPDPTEPEMTNRERYEPLVRFIAQEIGIDADLFVKQIAQESGFDPHAVSPSGAEGLGQLMPQWYPNVDRFDPEDNLRAAAASMLSYYSSMQRQFPGDSVTALALASYNAGLTAMTKWRNTFGTSWRRSLVTDRDRWLDVSGYGDERKADQVAAYLNSILGADVIEPPQPEPEEPDMRMPTKVYPTNNHSGTRPKTLGIVIHSTRGGRDQPLETEYRATINWFQNPNSQVSAHRAVGPSEVAAMVGDDLIAWHAGTHNSTHLGIEVCQPLTTTPFTDAQYRETAAIVKEWAKKYGIPLKHVTTTTQPGLIGHEETEQGRSIGKTDPGKMWDWNYFMGLLSSEPVIDKNIYWQELVEIGQQVKALGETLMRVNAPHNTTYTAQQSLDETWRIKGLLEKHAARMVELVNILK